MIISIAGLPGSGKTTKARMLSERLGIPWYSVGALRGKMALERGMTIHELNALGEKEAFTDKEVDDYQKSLGERGESLIMEGRMSWYFIPQSFKVFLDCDPNEAARRVMNSPKEDRADEPDYTSLEEAKQSLMDRTASDQRRYQKYYGVDFLDPKNYDAVIDTTNMTADESCAKILELFEAKYPGALEKMAKS